jgi:hypothetical protein
LPLGPSPRAGFALEDSDLKVPTGDFGLPSDEPIKEFLHIMIVFAAAVIKPSITRIHLIGDERATIRLIQVAQNKTSGLYLHKFAFHGSNLAAIKPSRYSALREDFPLPHLVLASAFGHIGQVAGAQLALATAERLRPNVVAKREYRILYRRPEDAEHILDGLRKAGWTG